LPADDEEKNGEGKEDEDFIASTNDDLKKYIK
jgi:hypothetical protein